MSPPTERVGRYQLLDPIGAGPNGTVSRAKVFGVAGFERQFALKRFHSDLVATPAFAQALSSAARAYGGLEHPRIARMAEFGVAQGTTFCAVEYVAGIDAMRMIHDARITEAPLPVGGALALVSQAARAIGYAHGRGLTHLGLAPTNVMVSADGDIKITDFGLLAATLPERPTDVPRLATRIGYLAPEQLAAEATSAATDVFALGVLAYELLTGERAFRGDGPQQLAQAVMAGPTSEPALPRPILRVLQRCLARSPFERFPDARAFADALDAAVRSSPVPGTRKDIGELVKATLERMEELHAREISGVVALNLAAALRADRPSTGRDSLNELATTEFRRNDTASDGIAFSGKTTVTGLAPPPVPPPRVLPARPTPFPGGVAASTPDGLPERPSETPVSPLRAMETLPSGNAPVAPRTILPRKQRDAETPPASSDSASRDSAQEIQAAIELTLGRDGNRRTTGEMPPLLDQLGEPRRPTPIPTRSDESIPSVAGVAARQSAVLGRDSGALASARRPAVYEGSTVMKRSRAPWIVGGVVAAGAIAAGAYVTWQVVNKPSSPTQPAVAPTRDAGTTVAVAPPADAAIVIPGAPDPLPRLDAGVATAPVDAGGPADAASKPATKPATEMMPGDVLAITTTPPNARVYIDGADAGTTPLKLPGTPDRHSVALFLPGHELHLAQLDGFGAHSIGLKEVTPTGGQAGIKVTKCKDKDRYYVFVDGKPTGQTCPTERIDTEVGPHTVEVYDLVSESRRKWDILIKDTRLSYRVKID